MSEKGTPPVPDAQKHNPQDNKSQQPVDKAPGEERGTDEQVTTEDLKGKKVDRDLADQKDEPAGDE